MKSNYSELGQYIREVNERNSGLEITNLLGVSMEKTFIKSVANINGVDMSVYKIIRSEQLACKLMSVGRDEKLPVDIYKDLEPSIVSSAYYVFEPKDKEELLPEYLMMWLCRKENDRYIGFISGGDVRGGISWETFCSLPIKVPSITKQREIVKEYNVIQIRIALNKKLIHKLEETAQAIYREWFVEGVDLENLPEGWRVGKVEDISSYISRGITPSYSENDGIVILNQKCVRNNTIELAYSRKHNEQGKKIPKDKLLKQFDILINSTGDGTLGRVGILKVSNKSITVDSHITILRTNPQNNPLYVWGNISSRSEEIANLAEGSTGQTELSRTLFSELPILIPEKVIQDRFAFIIEKEIWHTHLLETENQKLIELKDLLLSKLATIK